MANPTVKEVLENIYTSIQNDNADLDTHIEQLKIAMTASGEKEVIVEPARLVQNNRQGRKLMQAYFRKRGVNVTFA